MTEPSLNKLYDFLINDFNNLSAEDQHYFDIKTFDVIEYYIFGQMTGALHGLLKTRYRDLEIAEKEPQKYFYLGGQVKISCDQPITPADIDKVQKIINSTDLNQCWGMEIYSVKEHNTRFERFKQFYTNYTEYITHKLYQPGGSKYYETMEHFNNTKE